MKATLKMGTPGLVVMIDDSCLKVRGFESQRCILDGHISHWYVVKIELFIWEKPKINEKEAGVAHFFKKGVPKGRSQKYWNFPFSHKIDLFLD